MDILNAPQGGKLVWNNFVKDNYPPVGAFMQTWEWGEFQKNLGREIERQFVTDKDKIIAAFTFVRYFLPLGYSYGYIPRGPVIAKGAGENQYFEIFQSIKNWAATKFPNLAFVRLEPPILELKKKISDHGIRAPQYYIQPRHNIVINIDKNLDEIASGFHPSTRSNLKRAENRGVTVSLKSSIQESDLDEFFNMARETIKRNSGKNVYPDNSYFQHLFKTIPAIEEGHKPSALKLGMFCGYQEGAPAAINFVLFFGSTATYLFGASYSDKLRSKVTTYLHWSAMQEAKKRGLKFYDLGGIDEIRWPTLTDFKRQFRGQEFKYIGNLDIPMRPAIHKIYDFLKRLKG